MRNGVFLFCMPLSSLEEGGRREIGAPFGGGQFTADGTGGGEGKGEEGVR